MNNTAKVEHEATTSRISEDQLFYLRQRGISQEDAVSLIINGFCKEVFRELPMEFAVEATSCSASSWKEALEQAVPANRMFGNSSYASKTRAEESARRATSGIERVVSAL
ncbi:MAG: SufD family Fe-S cluster assembly protein [Pyrinomonadaceae bacterium]